MSLSIRSGPFRYPSIAAIGVLVLGSATLGGALTGAPPAAAHDDLISSTPLDGAVLETAPSSVDLVFTADIMDLGAAVIVVDPASTDHAAGEPELAGTTLTQELDPLDDGAYQVRWRVVSSDGHPIAGSFDFIVGDPAAAVPVPALDTAAGTSTVEDTSGTAGEDLVADPASSTTWFSSAPLWQLVALGAAGGLGIFALVTLVLRRRA